MAPRYIVIDLETTGLTPIGGDRVIELAAVSVEYGKFSDEFHSLIQVPRTISKAASLIHGITQRMISDQPFPEEIYPVFSDFIGDSVLIAHNARFDISFLIHEFGRLGMSLPNRHACTLRLARRRLPDLPDHRLETVYFHLFGEPPEDNRRHRALDDARLTARVWLALVGGQMRYDSGIRHQCQF